VTKISYDKTSDTLAFDFVPRNATQISDHLTNEMLGRFNTSTGELENLDVQSFMARLEQGQRLVLPLIFGDISNLEDAKALAPAYTQVNIEQIQAPVGAAD
jgi:hypothetical protein